MIGRTYLIADTGKAASPGSTAERCTAAAASGPGLSKGHIITKSFIRFTPGACFVRIERPYEGDLVVHQQKKPRGKCVGFSAKARARFRARLAHIDNVALSESYMLTLTYPKEFPDPQDFPAYKEHLRRFNQECLRCWNLAGIWAQEFQKREAVHFHALLFGLEDSKLSEFQAWVSRTWYDICGTGDEKHLRAGTSVEKARSPHGARHYLCKYLSKTDQSLEGVATGRHWGEFNRSRIPYVEEKEIEVTEPQARIAQKVAKAFIIRKCRESGWRGLLRFIKSTGTSPHVATMTPFQLQEALRLHREGRPTMNYKTVREFEGERYTADCTVSTWYVHHVVKAHGGPPNRWRMRNNSSMNVLTDATAFMEALSRHPDFSAAADNKDGESPQDKEREREVRRVCDWLSARRGIPAATRDNALT